MNTCYLFSWRAAPRIAAKLLLQEVWWPVGLFSSLGGGRGRQRCHCRLPINARNTNSLNTLQWLPAIPLSKGLGSASIFSSPFNTVLLLGIWDSPKSCPSLSHQIMCLVCHGARWNNEHMIAWLPCWVKRGFLGGWCSDSENTQTCLMSAWVFKVLDNDY